MGRRRFGVAVFVPRPVATEVDGLRRAFGDRAIGRIAPHITLVPPVNVRDENVADAVAAVDAAAVACQPFAAALGAADTFWPTTPVLYLTVGDESARAALDALRAGVFVPPLARPIGHDFEPHVTIGRHSGPGYRLDAGVSAFSAYEAPFEVDRLSLMELLRAEDDDGESSTVWTSIHEAPLGGPTIVARGPMQVELSATAVVSDDALALLAAEHGPGGSLDPVDGVPVERVAERRPPRGRVVVTARRDRELLGVVVGRRIAEWSTIDTVVVAPAHRGQGIAGHLRRAFDQADVWG